MLTNAFILALRELRRNKMRSFLTMLGIIIGVAAVISLVTIGGGATRQVTDQISSLGSNLMMVMPGRRMGPGQGGGGAPFKLADAEAIAREIPSIRAVAPTSASAVTAIYANENWSTTVTGTTDRYFDVSNLKIEEGRGFAAPEIRSGAAVCIIGATVRENLFGRQNPIGSKIRLNKLSCEIIGLLESKGQSSMGSDQDDTVIIPLRTFQRRISGKTDVNVIRLSVKDGVSTDKMKKEIGYLMRERRHLSDAEEDDFSVMDMKEISTMLTGTTKVLTGLLGAVAAVSLLVGGIGIMNIMMVSVTERTREIGLRKALGARKFDIQLQFLTESAMLSVFGGLIGIGLGWLLGKIVGLIAANSGTPLIPEISLKSVLLATLFSLAVGLFFGWYPALRAANLEPVEALRYE